MRVVYKPKFAPDHRCKLPDDPRAFHPRTVIECETCLTRYKLYLIHGDPTAPRAYLKWHKKIGGTHLRRFNRWLNEQLR